MVILIGGASHTGKTLLAQKLLERYKMPYLSIDHLKMGFIKGVDDCSFTATDSNEHIGEKLWPILKGIITTNIENGQNIIIEGCYLLPDKIAGLNKSYSNDIITIFLVFSPQYIKNNFSSITKHSCIIEKRFCDICSEKDIIKDNEAFRQMCEKNNVAFFEITENYALEIKEVYKWLDKKIATANKSY